MTPQRLFFALWPPAAVRAALQAALSHLPAPPGRAMQHADWHLTLAFIGDCDAARCDCLLTAAATVQAPGFALRLDRAGYFAGARVAWAGCSQPPAALHTLRTSLDAALHTCGRQPEARPFVPHVTLARYGTPWPQAPLPPVEWPVRAFVLAESLPAPAAPRYAILQRWPLLEPAA